MIKVAGAEIGFVGGGPFASSAYVDWKPPANLRLGAYDYRAQLVSGSIPVADVTSAEWIDIHRGK